MPIPEEPPGEPVEEATPEEVAAEMTGAADVAIAALPQGEIPKFQEDERYPGLWSASNPAGWAVLNAVKTASGGRATLTQYQEEIQRVRDLFAGT